MLEQMLLTLSLTRRCLGSISWASNLLFVSEAHIWLAGPLRWKLLLMPSSHPHNKAPHVFNKQGQVWREYRAVIKAFSDTAGETAAQLASALRGTAAVHDSKPLTEDQTKFMRKQRLVISFVEYWKIQFSASGTYVRREQCQACGVKINMSSKGRKEYEEKDHSKEKQKYDLVRDSQNTFQLVANGRNYTFALPSCGSIADIQHLSMS